MIIMTFINLITMMFIVIIIMVISRMTIEKTVDTQGVEKWSVAEVETLWIRRGKAIWSS